MIHHLVLPLTFVFFCFFSLLSAGKHTHMYTQTKQNKVLIPLIALYASGKPYRRGFYCDDTSIRYPFKESTVSNTMLIVFTTAIPFLTIIGVEFIRFQRSARRSSSELRSTANIKELAWISYNELIVFFFGNLANLFLTNIAKYSIGRLRPHFLQVCRPRNLDALCPATANNYNYIENYECMSNDGAKLKEARLSFFSGHSSIAAYAMVFTVVRLFTSYLFLCVLFSHNFPFLSFANNSDLHPIQG